MCTSTVAAADALPAQPAMVIGDSTVERSGICTSVPLVAAHAVGDGDGDGVGLGDGDGVGLGDGDGEGDGVGLGDGDGDGDGDGVGLGVGVALGSTVNDRVSADEPFPAKSIAYIENVYEPVPSPLYVFGDEQLA